MSDIYVSLEFFLPALNKFTIQYNTIQSAGGPARWWNPVHPGIFRALPSCDWL